MKNASSTLLNRYHQAAIAPGSEGDRLVEVTLAQPFKGNDIPCSVTTAIGLKAPMARNETSDLVLPELG